MARIVLIPFLLFPLLGQAAGFYWVGGSGTWNDVGHWATSSGGATLHFGTPSANDDVFFDENSFPDGGATVDLLDIAAQCRTLRWTSLQTEVEVTGSTAAQWDVHADLLLTGAVNWTYDGSLTMRASGGTGRLDAGGRVMARNLLLDGGATAAFTILGDVGASRQVQFVSGGVTFSPGVHLRAPDLFFEGEGEVDYADILLEASRRINLTVTDAELPSLRACRVLFTGERLNFHTKSSTPVRFARIEHNNPSGRLSFRTSGGAEAISADTVILIGDAIYSTGLNAGYLRWAPGSIHSLSVARSINVDHLEALGECTRPVSLIGIPGSSVVADAGATIELTYFYVEDVTATGGNAFPAPLSGGTGDVSGWTFTGPNGPDRYWVGGTGRWNEPAHWAFTSGGAPGACPPLATGNAVFDAASFNQPGDTVYLTPGALRTNNFDWRELDQPTVLYHLPDALLNIYGSMYLHPDLTWSAERSPTISFLGHAVGREIVTHARTDALNFQFSGADGDWTLGDSLTLLFNLFVDEGRLNTDGHSLSAGYVRLRNSGFIDFAESLIHIRDFGGRDTQIKLDPRDVPNAGFLAADARVVSDDAGGTLDMELRNANGGANHITSIVSAGVLELDAPGLYAQRIDARASARFGIDGRVDSLLLHPGGTYFLVGTGTRELTLDYLRADGDCFNTVSIVSNTPYAFSSALPQRGMFLQLENISATGPAWEAASSLDLGGNAGWTFTNQPAPRTLYWVGGEGHWFDPANWAMASGGTGGACLPTRIDDVIFDAASFSAAGQTVNCLFDPMTDNDDDPVPVCRTLDARALTTSVIFDGRQIDIHGSCYLSDSLTSEVKQYALLGGGMEELLIRGLPPRRLNVAGEGTFDLIDSVYAPRMSISQRNGLLRTNGFDLEISTMTLSDAPDGAPNVTVLDMTDSEITIINAGIPLQMVNFREGRMRSGNAAFVFTRGNVTVWTSTATDGVGMRFTAPEGTASLELFSRNDFSEVAAYGTVFFAGDGRLRGPSRIDTLVLSKGYAYRLGEAPIPLEVTGELRAVGTACNPISVSPLSNAGRNVIAFGPGAEAAMDYVRLDRVDAAGPVAYLSGRNSVNVNNSSTGWVFETNSTVQSLNRFFLGEDQALCTNAVPEIVPDLPENFTATYQWENGPATPDFQPPGPGIYRLRVVFDDGQCSLTDSVSITTPDYALDLPTEVSVCGDDEIRLDLPDPAATGYAWSVSEGMILTTDATGVSVAAPGRYLLRQTLGACTDSTEVTVSSGAAILTTESLAFCESGEVMAATGSVFVSRDTTFSETFMAAGGCDSVHTYAVTVAGADDIVTNIAVTNARCDEPLGGSFSVSVAAGATDYELLLSDTLIGAGARVRGLGEGVVTVVLRYGDGCERTYPVAIGLDAAEVSGGSTVFACEAGPFVTPLGTYEVSGDTTFTESYPLANGCDSLHTWAIDLTTVADVLLAVSSPPADCASGTGELLVETVPGTTARFEFYLDGAVISTDVAITGLPFGDYDLQLAYGEGCDYRQTVTVAAEGTAVSLDTTILLCEPAVYVTPLATYAIGSDTLLTERYALPDGCDSVRNVAFRLPEPLLVEVPATLPLTGGAARPVEALIFGGSPPYIFAWSLADSLAGTLSCTNCAAPLVSATATTELRLRVTDAAGCAADRTIALPRTTDRRVYPPTAFSPNGDGTNDRLAIFPGAGGTLISLRVFDRWGGLRYEAAEATPDAGWDGAEAVAGRYLMTWAVRWADGEVTRGEGMVVLLR